MLWFPKGPLNLYSSSAHTKKTKLSTGPSITSHYYSTERFSVCLVILFTLPPNSCLDQALPSSSGPDFFKAPASTRFHGNYEGGLLEHSMKVYEILKQKVANSVVELEVGDDTLIIVALLHDICKVNFYKVDYRNAKNERGEWEKVPYYTVEDTIPYGHGEKSVMMLTEYMKLTSEEKYAIRWHMGFSEPKELYNTLGQAFKKYPLALMLYEADLESTYLFDI